VLSRPDAFVPCDEGPGGSGPPTSGCRIKRHLFHFLSAADTWPCRYVETSRH
jgi:hypothetical protein